MLRKIGAIALFWVCWLWMTSAQAGPLADRLAAFPQWQDKPPVETAVGDLAYPTWFTGIWQVTSTLVDLAAPLAPDVVTPGFEGNRQYLGEPVSFRVRFVQTTTSTESKNLISLRSRQSPPQLEVVADRAFNGINLARAYLGDRAVLAVKVDPSSPNRQVTLLKGDRQLVSIVTDRATETPAPDRFITTEVFQQQFRGTPQLYFNQVESTTAYQYQPERSPVIEADQVTAIYLSPQDPDYFKAGDRPVALYRYRLEFTPVPESSEQASDKDV